MRSGISTQERFFAHRDSLNRLFTALTRSSALQGTITCNEFVSVRCRLAQILHRVWPRARATLQATLVDKCPGPT